MEARLRNLGTLGALLSLPTGVFTAGYSKTQEFQADRFGIALAVAAGYSPDGILQLMGEFERRERTLGASRLARHHRWMKRPMCLFKL